MRTQTEALGDQQATRRAIDAGFETWSCMGHPTLDGYRKGDPSLFHQAASLEEIIRILGTAPEDHVYKGALDDLRGINEYSRGDNHAAVQGNPSEETSIEELKEFSRLVLDLTRGM